MHSSCFEPNSLRKPFKHIYIYIYIYIVALVIAIYSASIVDKTTHLCRLDYHNTTPPEKVIKYPYANLLLSMSLTISTFVNPSKLPQNKNTYLRYLWSAWRSTLLHPNTPLDQRPTHNSNYMGYIQSCIYHATHDQTPHGWGVRNTFHLLILFI